MSLFQKLFGKRPATPPVEKYEGEWKLLGGTEPRWRNHGAELYESELIRAAINAIATHCSKLNVVMTVIGGNILYNRIPGSADAGRFDDRGFSKQLPAIGDIYAKAQSIRDRIIGE